MKHKFSQALREPASFTHITLEAENAGPDSIFFLWPNQEHQQYIKHIKQAIAKGIGLIVLESGTIMAEQIASDDKILYVECIREALASAIDLIYPKQPSKIIAITGTNGKSSVAAYVHQLLNLLKVRNANIGTLGVIIDEQIVNAKWADTKGLTTPDNLRLRMILHNLASIGIEHVVIEASSHGIIQNRLRGVQIWAAAFTSFSQDHLDFHANMADYLSAKLQLFAKYLSKGHAAVINSELLAIPMAAEFLQVNDINIKVVGNHGKLNVQEITSSLDGQLIKFNDEGQPYEFNTPIMGSFQATNLLIAAQIINELGIDLKQIVPMLSKVVAVHGRLQQINTKPYILIDYAHTPDALQRSLDELRLLKQKGKLWVLFGCGGNRDRQKRPIMGQIAHQLADYIIITDDNPRNEDAARIRQEILQGITEAKNNEHIIEIAGRKQAIEWAVQKLAKDDILLIAGKGHEQYQLIAGQSHEFNEINIVKQALQQQ